MSENDAYSRYASPLVTRNASDEMSRLFGEEHRIVLWRRLWTALADAQRQLGLNITQDQVDALRAATGKIDFDRAGEYERESRHDVMAHLLAFADQAPGARPVLHLGATSAFVVDNADLIIIREALELVRDWLANVVEALGRFAEEHKDLATLGWTHFQPAQPTTVGKRATLWAYDFICDLREVEHRLRSLRFRGVKGTTGTQAGFLALFDGDHDKVERLERIVAEAMGFEHVEPVTGQTYSRKVDAGVVGTLGGIAASVHKFANDVRLLSHLKEIEEPFEEAQVGSSAMPYKRNPMRCERATGLARLVISLVGSPLQTAAEQWLERTLDDSSNKRVTIPESFLATDGMLRIVVNVARGLVVYPKTIAARVAAELPFMAVENILMAAVKAGGDRQDLHEAIRRHAQAAANRVKQEGKSNDLLDRLKRDPLFREVDIDGHVAPAAFIGRAPQQVEAFLEDYVQPVRREYASVLGRDVALRV